MSYTYQERMYVIRGDNQMSNLYRQIPAVDKLLRDPRIIQASEGVSSREVTWLLRASLEQIRSELKASQAPLSYEEIVQRLQGELQRLKLETFQTVLNATGVLLHTNLGRAPLPDLALERINQLAKGYFNLELALETGERGSRYTNVARLFNLLSESEDSDTIVVNNNAGAILVALKALTAGSEVIVSRGQLVEIGGSFRVPDVLAASGSILKEVGTTNRTHLADYKDAINCQTKAILLVHPSNYTILGFTQSVPRDDLAQLCAEHGLLLIEDLGSGAFSPFPEPLVPTALRASHIVTYSGDKLLGGPQAGIISGRRDLVAKIKNEPLLRALRIDKLSLLALEAVLELYLNKEYSKLPLWALASLPPENIKERAVNWLRQLGPGLKGEVLQTYSTMGGGSLPGETIPSWALVLESPHYTAQELAQWFRQQKPSLMGRVSQERFWLDPRTVLACQDAELVSLLQRGVY